MEVVFTHGVKLRSFLFHLDGGTATSLGTLLTQHNTSAVYFWGSGVKIPTLLSLPRGEQNVTQVSVGRTMKLAVTASGRVMSWEVSRLTTEVALSL